MKNLKYLPIIAIIRSLSRAEEEGSDLGGEFLDLAAAALGMTGQELDRALYMVDCAVKACCAKTEGKEI